MGATRCSHNPGFAPRGWLRSRCGALGDALRGLWLTYLSIYRDSATGDGSLERDGDRMGFFEEYCRLWLSRRVEMMAHALDRVCPVCESRSSEPYFTSQDGYDYRSCSDCSMVFARDPIPMEGWNTHYGCRPEVRELEERRLAQQHGAGTPAADGERFEFYLQRMRSAIGALAGKRYLDVGTFYGDALEVAGRAGLAATGLEGKALIAEHARRLGRNVHFGTSENLEGLKLGAPFDIVSAYEILEHTVDPARSLRAMASVLRPEGLLVVTVPHLQNFEIQTLREYCFHLLGGVAITGHVNLFDRSTLGRLLSGCGFDVVDTFSQYGSNLLNVHLHQTGRWDRIYCYESIVAGRNLRDPVEPAVNSAIGTIGPAFHRWEHAQGMGPILGVLARKR